MLSRRSTDIINKYTKYIKIIFSRNQQNIGFALNAIKTVELATGKYSWLIVNDDLILPNTLMDLKVLFESNSEIDYFFINSYYLNSKELKNFSHPFNTLELNKKKMEALSKMKEIGG